MQGSPSNGSYCVLHYWNIPPYSSQVFFFILQESQKGEESDADKNPELNEELQGASGVLLESQATASRSEQEKELTIVVQQKAWEIHDSGVLVDMDL